MKKMARNPNAPVGQVRQHCSRCRCSLLTLNWVGPFKHLTPFRIFQIEYQFDILADIHVSCVEHVSCAEIMQVQS